MTAAYLCVHVCVFVLCVLCVLLCVCNKQFAYNPNIPITYRKNQDNSIGHAQLISAHAL